jgi:hypothetical protein
MNYFFDEKHYALEKNFLGAGMTQRPSPARVQISPFRAC